jgi:hypothetical protein
MARCIKKKVMAIITKLKDEKFFGKHPNGIDEGFTIQADVTPEIPLIGFSYRFGRLKTSEVTEIVSVTETEYIFKTRNSTYKIEL